ncbi:MAG: hypothetical protein RL580_1080, partial [Pseudomonadota bacterium]
DLSQYFCVRDEPNTLGDKRFKPALCIDFVGVGRSDEIERHTGVDEDHGAQYPPEAGEASGVAP